MVRPMGGVACPNPSPSPSPNPDPNPSPSPSPNPSPNLTLTLALTRKQKMRGFLRRHAARLFAKRGGAGRAELEVLQNAQARLPSIDSRSACKYSRGEYSSRYC